MAKNKAYTNSFHGLAVYDLAAKKYIFEYNAEKYFTPASNVKLFTFYAGLLLLKDTIPALRYQYRNDSLIIWGTGDPSQLHPVLKGDAVVEFLKSQKANIFFSAGNFSDQSWGAGWAWNDYLHGYQPEKSPLPLYGNCLYLQKKADHLQVIPKFFACYLKPVKDLPVSIVRSIASNDFIYNPATLKEEEIPFRASDQVIAQLLADTVGKPVVPINMPLPEKNLHSLKGLPTKLLYKVMLQESDNLLAEQILLLCANELPQGQFTLRTDKVIEHLLKNHLSDLSQPPRWVDGSGLSRYNLFTPKNFVEILCKIYYQVATDSVKERNLFELLPQAGRTGTLRNVKVYPPSVYAKTGTLSNNHNLSGFMITRSGKRLAFSFMNNHFMQPTSVIREEMGKILWQLYYRY